MRHTRTYDTEKTCRECDILNSHNWMSRMPVTLIDRKCAIWFRWSYRHANVEHPLCGWSDFFLRQLDGIFFNYEALESKQSSSLNSKTVNEVTMKPISKILFIVEVLSVKETRFNHHIDYPFMHKVYSFRTKLFMFDLFRHCPFETCPDFSGLDPL